MNVGDLLASLASQELKTLPVAMEDRDRGVYEIVPIHQKGLVDSINLGLTDLHTKFNLVSKELIINSTPSVSIYELHSYYALSNSSSDAPNKYIADSNDNKFEDDLIKVIKVYLEDGRLLPINDGNSSDSAFTTAFNMLQLPYISNRERYSVIYQANHKKIENAPLKNPPPEVDAWEAGTDYAIGATVTYMSKYWMATKDSTGITPTGSGTGPSWRELTATEISNMKFIFGPLDTDQEIILPPSMHEALRLFVAAKVLSSTNSSEQINKSIQLLNSYTLALANMKNEGIVRDNVDHVDTRFERSEFP